MTLTAIGWTASCLQQPITLARDLRVDQKVLLAAGAHAPGEILPGFTFNGWTGCEKVSRACKHCYAEAWSKRAGYTEDGKYRLRTWGPAATTLRVRTSAANWKRPLAWNRVAAELGTRLKVFAHSLSDVGENHPMVGPWREDLFELIERTPHLDWLLLTKRPEHLAEVWPKAWREQVPWGVWVGATVEDQTSAETRIPALLTINAATHFVSCEPIVGRLDLDPLVCPDCGGFEVFFADVPGAQPWCTECDTEMGGGSGWLELNDDATSCVEWVIAGGESGAGHEAMELPWLESLHRQAAEAGVAFFCKQDSGQHPGRQGRIPDHIWATKQFPMRGEKIR